MLRLGLEAFEGLSEDDRELIGAAALRTVRTTAPRRDLIREGEQPRGVILILEGWACRYKAMPDGRRQILDFLLPGEFGDANVFMLRTMDHSIGAITPVHHAEIERGEFERLTDASPALGRAFWKHQLVASAVAREWIVNVGQRTAYQRLAHLLCEIYLKLGATGRIEAGACEWPLTQNDLAEATGLTSVHVNRTLQLLRRDGLIELTGRRLVVRDLVALQRVASFNPDYLHFEEGFAAR